MKLKNESISTLKIKFNNTQTRADTLKNIMNVLPDSQVVMNLGNNTFFALNKNNMNSLYQRMNDLEYSEYDFDSRTKAISQINKVNNISVSVIKPPPDIPLMDFLPDDPENLNINTPPLNINNINNFNTGFNVSNKLNGDFFKYTHNLPIDLSRYGVYKKETSFKDRDYKNNCLIKALRNIEMNDIVLQDIMLKCKNRCIPMYVLKQICIKHKFTINLKIFYEKRNTKKMKYGTEGQVIELCLYDDHFFLNEKVDITYYALTHYEELKDKENWNMYFTENRIYNTDDNKDRSTDSFEIVKYLIDNKDKFL